MEVWLLEMNYGSDGYCMELYLHVPDTDLWLTNTAYWGEHIEAPGFTQNFWDKLGEEDKLTKVGKL